MGLVLSITARLFIRGKCSTASLRSVVGRAGLSGNTVCRRFSSGRRVFRTVFRHVKRRGADTLTGMQSSGSLGKLRGLQTVFGTTLFGSGRDLVLAIAPYLLSGPHFLTVRVTRLCRVITPGFVRPVLLRKVSSNSVQTAGPRTLTRTVVILSGM